MCNYFDINLHKIMQILCIKYEHSKSMDVIQKIHPFEYLKY